MDAASDAAESWPAAWWVWVVGQAAVVAIYATGVRFSGGYPLPVADTADLGVATVQLILAALLGPVLLATPQRALHAACPAVVFTGLAALLAGRSIESSIALLGVTWVWIAAIAQLVRSDPGRLVALFLTLAGPMLFYLSAEYGGFAVTLTDWPAMASPVLGVCSTRLHHAPWRAVLLPVVVLVVLTSARIAAKRRHAFNGNA